MVEFFFFVSLWTEPQAPTCTLPSPLSLHRSGSLTTRQEFLLGLLKSIKGSFDIETFLKDYFTFCGSKDHLLKTPFMKGLLICPVTTILTSS